MIIDKQRWQLLSWREKVYLFRMHDLVIIFIVALIFFKVQETFSPTEMMDIPTLAGHRNKFVNNSDIHTNSEYGYPLMLSGVYCWPQTLSECISRATSENKPAKVATPSSSTKHGTSDGTMKYTHSYMLHIAHYFSSLLSDLTFIITKKNPPLLRYLFMSVSSFLDQLPASDSTTDATNEVLNNKEHCCLELYDISVRPEEEVSSNFLLFLR